MPEESKISIENAIYVSETSQKSVDVESVLLNLLKARLFELSFSENVQRFPFFMFETRMYF